jgi:hypothetical protein
MLESTVTFTRRPSAWSVAAAPRPTHSLVSSLFPMELSFDTPRRSSRGGTARTTSSYQARPPVDSAHTPSHRPPHPSWTPSLYLLQTPSFPSFPLISVFFGFVLIQTIFRFKTVSFLVHFVSSLCHFVPWRSLKCTLRWFRCSIGWRIKTAGSPIL